MNTLDFLKLVWPSTGHYLVLIPSQYIDRQTNQTVKFFKHFGFPTIDEAAQHALALAYDRDSPVDTYFALAPVKEDLTKLKKKDLDALGKKYRGIHKSGHDNTAAVKCFWLDVDVDMEKAAAGLPAYATREEAQPAIRGFVQAMGLPRPYVVNSGGGYHVYWPLTEELDPEKWQHYASILKQLAVSWGLKADPTRTADRASILRPVGTLNWKTGTARPVEIVVNGTTTDTTQLLQRLAYLAETMSLPAQQAPSRAAPAMIAGTAPVGAAIGATLNDDAMNGAGWVPPDPRDIVARCPQLAWQASNQAQVSEPQWYNMIGCMRFADQGRRAVHFMSRLSPNYDPVVTDQKIDHHIESGVAPTRCSTFEQNNPGGCANCPFKGKISTPLQVVRRLEEVAPPTVTMQYATGPVASFALPPPPKPFKRVVNPLSGNTRIAMTIGDPKTGGEFDEVIYEYDIYPCRLIFDERESRYNVVVKRWLPQDGEAEFEVPTGKLYDKKNLAITFGDIGVLPDLGHVEALVQYMIGYIRDLQKAAAANVMYAQLGWRADMQRFILPDRVVTPIGSEMITPSRNIENTLSWVPSEGSLEEWKKIAAVYERPGMEGHQFGFGVGFASPLFQFTNFKGMIVSLVGLRGAGKSSAAMLANSIWGHSEMGWADLKMDTLRAFYQKLGVLKNLPATYDEHTNLEGEVVSDLCYTVSKGQGRQRLKTNGESMENYGNFQLMMLMTGNTSLIGRLAEAKADSSAEAARVFEYFVPSNTLTKSEADDYFGPGGLIKQHFGMAGEVYARQLIGSVEWSRERVRHWVKVIDERASVSSGERFWSAGAACVLTGFELANACGLTNANIDRLLEFSVRTINEMRVAVTDNTKTPNGIVADYLNGNLSATLILDSDAQGSTMARTLNTPTNKLRVRYERHTGKIFIDRADFRRFCGTHSVDPATLAKEMQASGVLMSTNAKVTLGKGTPWSGVQTICWVLNAKHHTMVGMGDLATVTPIPGQVPQQATP